MIISPLVIVLWTDCAMAQDILHALALGSVDSTQSPIPNWLSADPAFEVSLVPTRMYDVEAITPDEARKMLRLYFPRTDKAMASYDLVIFSGGDVRYFLPEKIAMIVRAVHSGAAAVADMGGMSVPLHPDWIASGIWEVFPNDVMAVKGVWDSGIPADQPFRIVVNRDLTSNPLLPFVALGIENLVGGRTRTICPRPGSTVYAWTEAESLRGRTIGFRPAAAVIWSYGKGRGLALEAYFGHSWWSSMVDPTQNRYGQDILINYLLDAAGRPYATDIELIHTVRQSFLDFQNRISFLRELMDFVEMFGARTDSLLEDTESAKATFASANAMYLEGDFQGALGTSEKAYSELIEIGEKAMRLKDRALQWIYLIEWLAVAGTLMIGGFALDQLMIRRRLYRRPLTTRLGA